MYNTQIKIVSITASNLESFSKYIFRSEIRVIFTEQAIAFGAVLDDTPCAAIVGTWNEEDASVLQISSLIVEESLRHQGIAHTLITFLKKEMQKRKIKKLECDYLFPTNWEMTTLFLDLGFSGPSAGNEIYEMPLSKIKTSEFMKMPPLSLQGEIMKMSAVPHDAIYAYKKQVGKEIPSFLAVESVEGTVIDEATLAYVEKDTILAFVVFSETEEKLYLHSLYTKKKGAGAILSLLQMAFQELLQKYDEEKLLYMSIINENSRNLLKRLAGAEMEGLQKEQVARMEYVL